MVRSAAMLRSHAGVPRAFVQMSADPDAPTIISRRRRRSLVHALGLFSVGFALGVALVFSDVLSGAVHDTRVDAATELRAMRSARALRPVVPSRQIARAPRKEAQPKVATLAPPTMDVSELPSGTPTVDFNTLPLAQDPALLAGGNR